MLSKVIHVGYNILRYSLLYLSIKFIIALGKTITEKNTIYAFLVELTLIVLLTISLIWISRKVDHLRLNFQTSSLTFIYLVIFSVMIMLIATLALYLFSQKSPLFKIDYSNALQSIFFAFYVATRGASEEVFYRGILFDVVGNRFSLFPTVLVTSVLFTVIHTFYDLLSPYTLQIFSLGLLCAMLRVFTDSIASSMLFHFSWNFYAGVSNNTNDFHPLLYIPSLDASTQSMINYSSSIVFIFASCFILIVYMYKERINNQETTTS